METFDFENINLVPRKCIVASRSECDTALEIPNGGKCYRFELPIIPANMECVIDTSIAEKLATNNYIYSMHRFSDTFEFAKHMKEKGLFLSISIGVNEDSKELCDRLYINHLYPDLITIDIAHGHAVKMKEMLRFVLQIFPNSVIMAGNVSTPEAVQDLEEWGADIIKVGIGPGCFKGDTRVLMANGIYKNIKDIVEGDYVINKDGKPVQVVNVANKGYRPVMRLKNNLFYKDTYVTKDHKFWVGDLSSSSSETISTSGIAKLLDQLAKTKPRTSKYKWKEVGECDLDKTFALLPKSIDWNLPEEFKIDLADTLVRGNCSDKEITTNSYVRFHRYLESSYELGYIFGTFLGDGSARIYINANTNCEAGSITWAFGEDELDICSKLAECISKVLNIQLSPKKVENKSMQIIQLYNKCLSRVLIEFGKHAEKHLPSKYYCKNKQYIQGIFDGLIDSDGHVEPCRKEGNVIYVFDNTSTQLIELYQWCCLNLGISFTSSPKGGNIQGGLKNITENSVFNKAYRVKTHTMNRFTNDYLYSNFLDYDLNTIEEETWDIEVDCPTHSFIANNMIVHNSACTTYVATGFGSRGCQASTIRECAKARKKPTTLICADGGIREPGDIAKSLALGADLVMVGGMFCGFNDSPGVTVEHQGKAYKEFWGSASHFQSNKSSRIEGTKKLIEMKPYGILREMSYLKECLQSAISYAGGKDLAALHDAKWILKHPPHKN